MKPRLALIGKKFGKLLVVARAGSSKNGKTVWECRCDCGNKTRSIGSNLVQGLASSCGCSRKNINIVHGLTNSKVYAAWCSIKTRCENPKHPFSRHYKGRGISISPLWKDNFEAFFKEMGHPPSDKHSIDRINNDGNYEPGNCRWATAREQSRNRRKPPILSEEQTKEIVERLKTGGYGISRKLAREYGVNDSYIYDIKRRKLWAWL